MPSKQNPKKPIATPSSRPKNRERSVAISAIIAFFLFLIGISVPGLTGMDMFQYGFGLGFISLFLAIISWVVFFFYHARADCLDQIFDSDALVHWVFPRQDWITYAKKEYESQKIEKRNIWLMIAGISVFVGIFFGLTTEDAWSFAIIFTFSLIGLLYLVSILAPALKYRSDLKNSPEAYISKKGVYLTGEFHNWGMLSSRLEDAVYDADKKLLSMNYSYMVRYGRSDYTLRIPVPKGQEKKAKQVADTLMKRFS
jgi:hypothetical protein